MESQTTHRIRHDWDSDTELITTLFEGLEEVVGQKTLMELPPLYDSVDPDALSKLFAPGRQSGPTRGVIQFNFAEYQVAIHATGEIVIYGA